MAVNLVSPGVKITEADLVSSVPSSGATVGATVGDFRWGPIEQPVLVANESELVAQFGAPNSTTIVDFLTATNYLAYSSALQVVRAANTTAALNATSESTTGAGGTGTGALIRNDDEYSKLVLEAAYGGDDGPWVAKYAGSIGNSLKISVCPSANAWSKTLTGTWDIANTTTTATSTAGAATTEVAVGDVVNIGTNTLKVASVTDANTIVFTTAYAGTNVTGNTVTRTWEYQAAFDGAPGTSASAASKGASNDEMHIVVVDEDGLVSGAKGTILERFAAVSKASDGRTSDGSTNYYKDVVNNRSKYVRWLEHDDMGTNWGATLLSSAGASTVYAESKSRPGTYSFAGGLDGAPTSGNKQTAFSKLANKETYDVSVFITGQADTPLVNHVIAIAEARKDCMVTFSPEKADVVNDPGDEVANILEFAGNITRSNYAIMDSGWKYQYNKYADNYVWVPLNADIAGCLARTDTERGPWFSPAGYAQGRILNAVKLAWNPDQNARDALYKNAVNPVVNQPGRGTVLFGDKTFVTKPGSFSRINVRRLFLTIEKAIGALANNLLFDLNDPATRAGFVNTVEPYLRSIVAQRGIEQFVVVCNETNNGEDIVNANSFVADFYIRPVFSINFIQLNFVSVAGAAAFAAIGG